MKKKYLIASALERTWPAPDESNEVYSLGSWVSRPSRKDIWALLSPRETPYHWSDKSKYKADAQFLVSVLDEMSTTICDDMNKYHRVSKSQLYWKIVVGPWLNFFVPILFDRCAVLDTFFKQNEGTFHKIRHQKEPAYSPVPKDMTDFNNNMMVSDEWNDHLFTTLIEIYWADRVTFVDSNTPESKQCLNESGATTEETTTGALRNFFSAGITLLNKLLTNKNDVLIYRADLSNADSAKLQMSLGQVPKLWPPIRAKFENRTDLSFRNVDIRDLRKTSFLELVPVLYKLYLPKSHLEDYPNLVEVANRVPWPRTPKAILTSFGFQENEVFKIYSADRKTNGVPLIVSQHGGLYGTGRTSVTEDFEVDISDRWISWGWSNENKKIVPCGVTGMSVFKGIKPTESGGLLLVGTCLPRYFYTLLSLPIAKDVNDYFDDQIKFCSSLSGDIRSDLTIAVDKTDRGQDQKIRWLNSFPNSAFLDETTSLPDGLRQSRVAISTYNATSLLELLFINFPTVAFWNPMHWELNQTAEKRYRLLKDANILFENPIDAAHKINSDWSDISRWWYSSKVQEARRGFCAYYARENTSKITSLKKIVESSTSESK